MEVLQQELQASEVKVQQIDRGFPTQNLKQKLAVSISC